MKPTAQSAPPPPPDPREEFHRFYQRGATLKEVRLHYGLSAEEVGLALHYARLSKIVNAPAAPPMPQIRRPKEDLSPLQYPNGKTWCDQCEQLVTMAQGAACTSQWCKGREAA